MDRGPIIAGSLAVALLLTLAPGAAAQSDLYEGQTITTGMGPNYRPQGFAECLADVLVKVSGDPRLLNDPAAAALGEDAKPLVQSFRYHDRMEGIPHHDEQGTRDRPYDLIARFDPAKIDAALRSLGREPWTGTRPRMVVFLGMRDRTSSFVLVAEDDHALEHEALAAAAEKRGVPVILPSRDAAEHAGVTFETAATVDLAALDAAASTAGGDLALAGRLAWSAETTSWIADWRFRAMGKTHQWHVQTATFDDMFRSALGGAAQILSGNGEPG